jgi:hypothetical protein
MLISIINPKVIAYSLMPFNSAHGIPKAKKTKLLFNFAKNSLLLPVTKKKHNL